MKRGPHKGRSKGKATYVAESLEEDDDDDKEDAYWEDEDSDSEDDAYVEGDDDDSESTFAASVLRKYGDISNN